MKKIVNAVKVLLLCGALVIVGSAVFPDSASAEAYCEGPEHTCHVLINGTLYHLKEIDP